MLRAPLRQTMPPRDLRVPLAAAWFLLSGAAFASPQEASPIGFPGCDAFAFGLDSGPQPIVVAPPSGPGPALADPYSDLLEPVAQLAAPAGNYMDLSLRRNLLAAARVFPGGGGVEFFDMSDPAQPVRIAEIRIPYPVWDVSLFEQGGTTFVALGNEGVPTPVVGAQIWALTDAGPTYVSHPSHLGRPENVHHVFVETRGAKRFLYCGASTGPFAAIDAHLDIYDVTSPADPLLLATLGAVPPTPSVPGFFVHDFAAGWNPSLGRYVLGIGALTQGIVLFDVALPGSPVFLAQFSAYGPSVDGHSIAVSADGAHVFLTNEIPSPAWGGLNVLDVTGAGGPGGIVEVSQYATTTSFVHYARRLGKFLFTSNAQDGMTVFEVSDPTSLAPVAWKATQEGTGVPLCWDVLPIVGSKGTFVVANEIGEGLEIFAFRPYRAERTGRRTVHSLASLGLRVRNLTYSPASVVARVFLEGEGGALSFAAPLLLGPHADVPFAIPSSAGPVPPGLYDLAFEVVQIEGNQTTYLDRFRDKFALR
ncbi:MAG TPA: hypothetical protein VFI25_17600 [Planctomycetota bacterium]|nr:hypothetical protein [Planctomycetota bacterium]